MDDKDLSDDLRTLKDRIAAGGHHATTQGGRGTRSASLDKMREIAVEEGFYGNGEVVSEYLKGLGRS